MYLFIYKMVLIVFLVWTIHLIYHLTSFAITCLASLRSADLVIKIGVTTLLVHNVL